MHFVILRNTLCSKSLQSCLTLCNAMDCSPPDCSIHGILQDSGEYWSGLPCSPPGDFPNPEIELRSPTLQANFLSSEPPGKPRILEWVAYPFSRGSSPPRNWAGVSCIAGGFFISWATREAHHVIEIMLNATQKMKDQGRLVFVLNCNLKEMEMCMNQS